ncbi:hypothetical protein FB451DRAFT_1187538 [Mycena latifolia]|nr:hypothetical protein FB451DRAFT_1187538 [Mycena latifolia]
MKNSKSCLVVNGDNTAHGGDTHRTHIRVGPHSLEERPCRVKRRQVTRKSRRRRCGARIHSGSRESARRVVHAELMHVASSEGVQEGSDTRSPASAFLSTIIATERSCVHFSTDNTMIGTYVESREVLREVFPLEDAAQADRAPTKCTSQGDSPMRLTTHSVQDTLDLHGGDVITESKQRDGHAIGQESASRGPPVPERAEQATTGQSRKNARRQGGRRDKQGTNIYKEVTN